MERTPNEEIPLDQARPHWRKWDAAGEAATREGRARLHAKGIGVVYEKDGIVVEELPDGTIRTLNEEVK